MTHKYDRISKVIKEFLGEDYEGLNIRIGLKHGDLVHFAYAVLEEFEKEEEDGNKIPRKN
jgi:hypothetical protein